MTRLEFQRKERQWNRQALARKTLFSRKTLWALETGKIAADSVHPALRAALEKIFDESLETLLTPLQVIDTGQAPRPDAA
jgi:transcriptional regulator with XRE-family HTH domain